MAELKINGLPVTVDDGSTLLDAANLLQVDIPTLCHMNECSPQTACMLCVVKDRVSGQLVPSCSAKAVDGMEIETECEEVQSARREILNLLLSEHVGDCEAPCRRICPAHLDIPHMLREIERGHADAAAWIARRDLAIPVVLSHVCPAPCEKGCRRKSLDEAISIRALHGSPFPAAVPGGPGNDGSPGRRVAVIGSGAAGLACAWQLHLLGFAATVVDEASAAGGPLRELETLPATVLQDELENLRAAGISFRLGKEIVLSDIRSEFEGFVIASPEFAETESEEAILAAEHKLAVKAVANGKAAAVKLVRKLNGRPSPEEIAFDSRIDRLRESELQELTNNCTPEVSGYDEPRKEAARCLHCDCRKPASCKLRRYAAQYGADASEYPADERGHLQLIGQHGSVIFEPGKCIKCGLCIEVAKRGGEPLGLAFTGRGLNTKVTVPFEENLQAGLQQSARECVEICPTGALAFRDAEERSSACGSGESSRAGSEVKL